MVTEKRIDKKVALTLPVILLSRVEHSLRNRLKYCWKFTPTGLHPRIVPINVRETTVSSRNLPVEPLTLEAIRSQLLRAPKSSLVLQKHSAFLQCISWVDAALMNEATAPPCSRSLLHRPDGELAEAFQNYRVRGEVHSVPKSAVVAVVFD